jgi:HlyD family secretion protein
VSGIVISRNVSEGQTVVASMSAQVLFQIATDLQRVQVEASIPEADIGKIRLDQPVTFAVDAYDTEFKGTVAQIRLSAATVQNVVTYPVVIRADNPEGKLFPGMTATITCEVGKHTDVLKVPNAALRFKPAADARSTGAKSGEVAGRGQGGSKVWIQKQPDGAPVPVEVKLGISDGSFTELKDPGELQGGDEVIVGIAEKGATSKATVNPFTPQMPGRRGGSH